MQKLPAPSPEWQQYINQGTLLNSNLSPLIAESWERSTKLKIDPHNICNNELLDRQALLERIENCQLLIKAASPIMLDLYNIVKGGGFSVLLSDNQGYILKSIGDPHFEEKVRKIWLSVGANWHESVKGTNALGTALVSGKAVNVFAWEHFCRENHILSCSAAPIFNPQGELAGVLDISSVYSSNDRHVLGSVVAAARAIENRLLFEHSQNQLVLACHQLSSVLEAVPEGLLSVDREGCITQINQAGSRLLGISPHDCIGQPLEKIFYQANQWLADLKHGKGTLEHTVSLETSAGPPNNYMVRMIANNSPNFYGVIASIRKLGAKNPSAAGATRYCMQSIIGCSPQIVEAKRIAFIAARNHSPVLLQGESGTGKEMFAQAIHNASDRSAGPFIAINCGAIPANLLESELFGYEDGAFTGAKKGGQAGKFELAQGGTIFLDEIGEMPLQHQISLLRILEEKQVVRIGGYTPIPIDVRVISATNKDLNLEVQQGKLRLDLYYRLNVLTIDIPPLRERGQDILTLTEHFLERLNRQLAKNVTKISPDFEAWLLSYPWPGNIRELLNILERAVSVAVGNTLYLEHLSPKLNHALLSANAQPAKISCSLQDSEKQAIKDTLAKTGGNISKSAKILGIGRNTLHRKLKEYNLTHGRGE